MSERRDQAYFDIFVTALEGGIGYWSVADSYRWRIAGTEDEDVLGFQALIRDQEDSSGKTLTVNRELIAKGVGKFIAWAKENDINPYFKRAAVDLDWAKWDDLDIDADVADAIVQFGLFDQLVYG